jgi:hypothetical protein
LLDLQSADTEAGATPFQGASLFFVFWERCGPKPRELPSF